MRRVEFLGHDETGKAVFRDCEYPSDAPRIADLSTRNSAWTSPDVFRMEPKQASHHYGDDYTRQGHEHRYKATAQPAPKPCGR
jgi:hypothetical protein